MNTEETGSLDDSGVTDGCLSIDADNAERTDHK